jgi:hypothetical protein
MKKVFGKTEHARFPNMVFRAQKYKRSSKTRGSIVRKVLSPKRAKIPELQFKHG